MDMLDECPKTIKCLLKKILILSDLQNPTEILTGDLIFS